MSESITGVRQPDSGGKRVLVSVDDTGAATVLPPETVDTDVAAGVTDGRLVIDSSAPPHDGDEYTHPAPPAEPPGP